MYEKSVVGCYQLPLNGIERKREYPRVIRAFGDQCFCCGIKGEDYRKRMKNKKYKKFLLHEAIYARPIQTINLRPICRSCNRKHEFSKDIILATQAVPTGITISHRQKIEFEKWLDGELELNNNWLDRKYVKFKSAYDIGMKLYGRTISSVSTNRYINEYTVVGNRKYTYSESTDRIYKKGYSPEERTLEIEKIEERKQGKLNSGNG